MVEESIEAIAGGQVIEQVLDRDACARKNRSPPEHVWIASDDGFTCRHVRSAFDSMVHLTSAANHHQLGRKPEGPARCFGEPGGPGICWSAAAAGTSPIPLTFFTYPCSASFSADVMWNSALLASQ